MSDWIYRNCEEGNHLACENGPDIWVHDFCTCPCHKLKSGERKALEHMCRDAKFRCTMIDLSDKAIHLLHNNLVEVSNE